MTILRLYYKTLRAKTPLLLALLVLALSSAAQAQFWAKKEPTLLPEDEAFAVTVSVADDGRLLIDWSIAEDYYMYRDQFAVESATPGVTLSELQFPKGVIEDDPEFGQVEVYFFNASLSAAIRGAGDAQLVVKGQGCNKPVGVCYPPIARTVSLSLPAGLGSVDVATGSAAAKSPDNASTPIAKSFLGYMVSAFFAGILLSFTPCVLPMIPILAGIIAGENTPSRARSGWLATCYVAGTIVTYIAAGALAGATGAQLQAWFQNVWVISVICVLLLLLAMSLFGLFRIEMPSSVQSRLSSSGGSGNSVAISSFSLGLVSALVVGACVSPVLIIALGAAITQGDPLLGAAIMGSMALGMGLLLILFGFGAGWLLPRTGVWMQQVQVIFGFMVLGVAIYLLSAFPGVPALLLWAGLLLCSGFYIWPLARQAGNALFKSVLQMTAAALLLWGTLAAIGGASQGENILRPLASFGIAQQSSNSETRLVFTRTKTLAEVQTQLQLAATARQPVMIDFYADWCLDCKRMHRTTYQRSSVQQAMQGWRLIEVDVTDTSSDSEQVKQHFGVFGPPATLFFASSGEERSDLRQYGYINENNFLALVRQVKQN